jgi:hypothetical protein
MLGQLTVRGEHRVVRHAFVEIEAHVYHSRGLLSQSVLAGSLSSQPIPGWAGGQRTYGITTGLCPARDVRASEPRAGIRARGAAGIPGAGRGSAVRPPRRALA